jgi:hypothetical protein
MGDKGKKTRKRVRSKTSETAAERSERQENSKKILMVQSCIFAQESILKEKRCQKEE